MEDLVRGLRNLGLRAPSPAQLLDLLDEDGEVRRRLVRVMAFSAFDASTSDLGQDGGAAALMGQELLQEAVAALFDNFSRAISRQRDASRREQEILQASKRHNNQSASSMVDSLSLNGAKKDANLTGPAPKVVRLPPRKALFARQEAALRRARDEHDIAAERYYGYRPRMTFDGDLSYVSETPLSSLKRAACRDLNLAPKRYEGRVLVCRVATHVSPYIGATFVVEDAAGDCVSVSISHLSISFNDTVEEVSKLLPIGTLVAIKEPLLSTDHQSRAGPCNGKSEIGIRVDSPTDLVVLDCRTDESETLIQGLQWSTPLDWRPEEDIAIPSWLGLRHVSGTSRATPADSLANVDNLLTQKRLGAALRMLRRIEKRDGLHSQRAKSLEANALFDLRAWTEAEAVFLEAAHAQSRESTGSKDHFIDESANFAVPISSLSFDDAARRCSLRREQERDGLTHDDVQSIYFASSSRSRLDTSDYVGPLAIRDIPGAGRGLVTTRIVKPGELLLCCRAVASAVPDDVESWGAPLVRLNVNGGVVSSTTQVRAQTSVIHAIADRGSELALPILGLTAGPRRPYSKYVSQPYPLRADADKSISGTQSIPRLDIDAAYVDGVLRYNAFAPAQSPERWQSQQEERRSPRTSQVGSTMMNFKDEPDSELSKSTMPHPLPAILNHACLPNVSSIFFSDVVTTRSLGELPAGTEIVHQYVRGEELYPIRSSHLSKHGFECACTLCRHDRADGKEAYTLRARIIQGEARAIYERSRVLMKRIDLSALGQQSSVSHMSHDAVLQGPDDVDAHRDVLESLCQLVSRINDTYALERGLLRPELVPVLLVAIKHVALVNGREAAIKMCTEAISFIGGAIDPLLDSEQSGVFKELPKLHMDAAIHLLLFIGVLSANQAKAGAMSCSQDARIAATRLSQPWTQAAFYGHQCMIGGGRPVFMDRWDSPDFAPALKAWQSGQQGSCKT